MKIKVLICMAALSMTVGLLGCSKSTTNASQEKKNMDSIDQGETAIESIGEDLYIEKIAEGAYVVNHVFPWEANSMVVEMDNSDIILVDTPYTPEATIDLLNWVNTHYKNQKIIAINTGFHFDNLGGNQALSEKNVPIYGSSLTTELISEAGEASRELMLEWLNKPESKRFYDAYQHIPYVGPTEQFDLQQDDMQVDIEQLAMHSKEIEIYFPGASHSPDNLVVYFPQKRILFGGCMVKSLESTDLGNTADADLEEWPKSVNRVLERYKDKADIIVPGHGKCGNSDLLVHTIELGGGRAN